MKLKVNKQNYDKINNKDKQEVDVMIRIKKEIDERP